MKFAAACLTLLMPLCANALDPGRAAPDFSARLLDGSTYKLADHRGQVVLLHFWATWCDSCQAELDALRAYVRAHGSAPLSVVIVSMDDPEQHARVAQMAKTLPFPVALSSDTHADDYGRIWRLPMNFVIDRKGVLRVDGGQGEPKPFDLPALEKTLTPLLQNE